jgi:hypothetical protein
LAIPGSIPILLAWQLAVGMFERGSGTVVIGIEIARMVCHSVYRYFTTAVTIDSVDGGPTGAAVPGSDWLLLVELEVVAKPGPSASIMVPVQKGAIVTAFNAMPATTPLPAAVIEYFARLWTSPTVRAAFLRPNAAVISSQICYKVLPAAASAIACGDTISAGAIITTAATAAAGTPLTEGVAVMKETY